MAGPLCFPLSPHLQARLLEELGLSGGWRRGTDTQRREEGNPFQVEEIGGCLSTEMHYFSPGFFVFVFVKNLL